MAQAGLVRRDSKAHSANVAKLGEYWGHQVVVENRPGGNGLIAMTAAVRADPDGYTLVMASGGDVSLNPALLEKMPYDVERDLVPITAIEISSGRIGRMRKPFMAGDRTDGLMNQYHSG